MPVDPSLRFYNAYCFAAGLLWAPFLQSLLLLNPPPPGTVYVGAIFYLILWALVAAVYPTFRFKSLAQMLDDSEEASTRMFGSIILGAIAGGYLVFAALAPWINNPGSTAYPPNYCFPLFVTLPILVVTVVLDMIVAKLFTDKENSTQRVLHL